MVTEREPEVSGESGAVRRRVKHRSIQQVGEVATDEALISTIGVLFPDLKLMNHVIEHFHGWLQSNQTPEFKESYLFNGLK